MSRAIVFTERSQTTVWSSTLGVRWSIHGGDLCADDDLLAMRILHYASRRGIDGDAEWAAGGASLRAQRVALHFPPGADENRALTIAAAGYAPDMRMDFTATFPWGGEAWHGTIWSAPQDDLEAQTFPMVAAQAQRGARMARTAPDPIRIEGDRAAAWAFEPSPVTYCWPAGELVSFGDGLSVPRVAFRGASSAGLTVEAELEGAKGEARVAAVPTELTLFDAGGAELARGLDRLGLPDAPGAMRVELQTRGAYTLEGMDGTATMSLRLGSGTADPVPPVPTTLRVVDAGGRAASRIGAGSVARMIVSAIDHDGSLLPARVDDASLDVSVRPTGTLAWTVLPVRITGEDYESCPARRPEGTIVSADLGAVTSGPRGYYDVRVRVADPAGNASETTLSPAFALVAPLRVRTARR